MKWLQNMQIKEWNTFGMDVRADNVYVVDDEKELPLIKEKVGDHFFVLGGGSNILFLKDVDIPLLKIELKGIKILSEDDEAVLIEVGAGEEWHNFVMMTVKNGWYGLENLSLIPGNVGAAPIQNIGAYGVEVRESIVEVRYFDWKKGTFESLQNEDCQFGYRDSVFKNSLKGKVIITSVVFRLSKKKNLRIDYGNLKNELAEILEDITIADVSNAVIKIRESKLPDPKKIGNGGSFFKNPVVSTDHFEQLKKEYPELPHYTQDKGVKIPAAWLIEQTGWKGKTFNEYGVHKNQSLVLVNYGHANGSDILDLSEKIIASVKDRFGIELEREVQLYGL